MEIETETLREDIEVRHSEGAFDYAVNNELGTIFARALKRLPQKQALVIKERFLRSSPWDLPSYRVMGKELGCSHENVRKLEAKGLDSLREMLGFLVGEFDSPNIPNILERIQPKTDTATKKYTPRLRPEQYASMTPLQKKERKQQLLHLWYLKNKDSKLSENKRIYREDKAYHHWLGNQWQQKNQTRWRQYLKQYQKQRSENLGDAYVAECLIKSTCLAKQDIPLSLIKTKRIQLQLIRLERKDKPHNEKHHKYHRYHKQL